MGSSGGRWHEVTNLKAVLAAVVLFVGGSWCLWWSTGDLTLQWSAFFSQLGGLLMATGLLSVVWELVGRRALAKEIYDVVGLQSEIVNAGIVRVPQRFYEDTPWGELFRDAQEIDIFVSYARAWRNQHHEELKAVSNRGRVRVFLPDFDDLPTLGRLQSRFNYPGAAEGVRHAVEWFQDLGPNVEVFLHKGDGLFTCYRFADRDIVAFDQHGQQSGRPSAVSRRFIASDVDGERT